jgi:hypothetical protein
MSELSPFLLLFGLLAQGCLLGANLFEAVVDVPNWSRPGGVAAYRSFITARNAGHFYRVLSPVSIVLLAAALVTGWGHAERDVLVATALGAGVLAEVFTVVYFFPRNARLFFSTEPPSAADQIRLVSEWGRANLLRCAVVALGLTAGMAAGMGLVGA